jgi:hypothetical protein
MSDDLVTVPVPRKYLSRVYGLIAELDGGVVTATIPSAPVPSPSEPPDDEWTPSRIRKMVQQSDAPMRGFLKALASHPGEWLSTEKLAQAIGDDKDWNTVAGMLGAFGRRLKSRYHLETKPFERRYEHGVGKVYRMSKEMAQQVLQALKNGD